jgi:hypothetical protein
VGRSGAGQFHSQVGSPVFLGGRGQGEKKLGLHRPLGDIGGGAFCCALGALATSPAGGRGVAAREPPAGASPWAAEKVGLQGRNPSRHVSFYVAPQALGNPLPPGEGGRASGRVRVVSGLPLGPHPAAASPRLPSPEGRGFVAAARRRSGATKPRRVVPKDNPNFSADQPRPPGTAWGIPRKKSALGFRMLNPMTRSTFHHPSLALSKTLAFRP